MNSGVIVDGTVKGAYRYQVPCILAGYILLPCGLLYTGLIHLYKSKYSVKYTGKDTRV